MHLITSLSSIVYQSDLVLLFVYRNKVAIRCTNFSYILTTTEGADNGALVFQLRSRPDTIYTCYTYAYLPAMILCAEVAGGVCSTRIWSVLI